MNKAKSKETAPIISVIIPAYNVEEFLDQCLTSVEDQTLRDLEIIVLNDGSTDSTLQIIQDHAKKDSRLKVIDKKNEGYGKTCNRGMSEAKGEWIAIVEPDDWIDKNMFFAMVNFACESELKFGKKVDIVKTPWFDVKNWKDENKLQEINGYLCHRLKTDLKPSDITKKIPLLEKHPSIWSAIYRKDFLEGNKIKFPEFPGSAWADNPFLIDTLIDAKNIIYLDKPFYHYRNDLPGSTHNHKTDELVALPFERWLGMTDQLRKKGVNDQGVWQAHYKRAFDYVHGAIVDDGWENEVVQAKAKQVFDEMTPDLVFDLDTLYPELKCKFAEVEKIDVALPKLTSKQMKFYAREAIIHLRQRGPLGLLKIAIRELS